MSALSDGTITFTATASDAAGNMATSSLTATKDAVVVNLVTDPVTIANQHNTSASGTGEAGATISLVVTDGTHSTTAQTTTVSAGGTWSISAIDVSALDDGTITFNVTATDLANNVAQKQPDRDQEHRGRDHGNKPDQ